MTQGIRTWKRLSSDTTLPVEARIKETTDTASMAACIAEADFLTLPREVVNLRTGELLHAGYDERYAHEVNDALKAHFDFVGGLRISQSGRSFVIERHMALSGGAFDFGVAGATKAPTKAAATAAVARQPSANGTLAMAH